MSQGPVCRFCGSPLRQTLVDLGMSPLCESYVAADRLNQMEPFYPLARLCLRDLSPGPARGVRQPGGDLHRIRLLLLLLRLLAAPRQGLRGHDRSAGSASAPELSSSSWPATTAISSSISSRKGIPVLGHRAGRERGQGRGRKGRPDPGRVLRREARARSSRPTAGRPT